MNKGLEGQIEIEHKSSTCDSGKIGGMWSKINNGYDGLSKIKKACVGLSFGAIVYLGVIATGTALDMIKFNPKYDINKREIVESLNNNNINRNDVKGVTISLGRAGGGFFSGARYGNYSSLLDVIKLDTEKEGDMSTLIHEIGHRKYNLSQNKENSNDIIKSYIEIAREVQKDRCDNLMKIDSITGDSNKLTAYRRNLNKKVCDSSNFFSADSSLFFGYADKEDYDEHYALAYGHYNSNSKELGKSTQYNNFKKIFDKEFLNKSNDRIRESDFRLLKNEVKNFPELFFYKFMSPVLLVRDILN